MITLQHKDSRKRRLLQQGECYNDYNSNRQSSSTSSFSMSLNRNNKRQKFEGKKEDKGNNNNNNESLETIPLPACIESDISPLVAKKKPDLSFYMNSSLSSSSLSSSSSSSSLPLPTTTPSSTLIEESPIIKRYREHQHRCFGCSHIGSSLPLIEDEALENLIFLFYNIKNTNINIHCENIHQFYENNIRSKYIKEEDGVKYYLLPEWTPDMIKEHLYHHQSDPTIHIQILMQKLTSSIYHIFATSLHTKKKIYLDKNNNNNNNDNNSNNFKKIKQQQKYYDNEDNPHNPQKSGISLIDQYCPFDEDFDSNDDNDNNDNNDDGDNNHHSSSSSITTNRQNVKRLKRKQQEDYNREEESDENNNDGSNEYGDDDDDEDGVRISKNKEDQNDLDEEEIINLNNEYEKSKKSTTDNEEIFSGVIDYNHELIGEEFDRILKKKRKYIIKYDVNMNNYKILDNMIKTYLMLGKSNPEETMKKFTSNETLDRLHEKKITTNPFFESTSKVLKPANLLKTTSTQSHSRSSTLTSQAINYCY